MNWIEISWLRPGTSRAAGNLWHAALQELGALRSRTPVIGSGDGSYWNQPDRGYTMATATIKFSPDSGHKVTVWQSWPSAFAMQDLSELPDAGKGCLNGGGIFRSSGKSGGGLKLLDTGRPLIMGVVNITPDSFYPGSRVAADRAACSGVHRRWPPRVRILSTWAVSLPVPEADAGTGRGEEIRAGGVPVVEALSRENLGDNPGIDRHIYKPQKSRRRLSTDAGAAIVNDIGAGLSGRGHAGYRGWLIRRRVM